MSNRYKGAVISATPPTVNLGEASGIWTPSQQAAYQAAGTWPAVTFPVLRSLRFNSADSAYLNKTFGSSGNRKTWTWSAWIKRGKIGTAEQYIFQSSDAATATSRFAFYPASQGSNDVIGFNEQSGGNVTCYSNAVLRDVSAWYHIVIAYDTTQATAANRIKIYQNDVQLTLTGSFPAQNVDGYINYSPFQHRIGAYTGNSNYFDGYMTEVHFVDGQALTPSSFGATNATTGVWGPIGYDGTYGTNGFYLPFVDNSGVTATTLGKDYSGNGNNWTPNNFSVTAGAGNDSLVDSPSSFGTDTGAGGEVRGNYCTLNPLDSALTGLNNGNLNSGTSGAASWKHCRSTFAMSTGKWYWECLVSGAPDGSNGYQTGVLTGSASLTADPNSASTGFYTRQSTNKYANGTRTDPYFTSTTSNDVLMFAFDADAGKMWNGKNGIWEVSGDPAAGTSENWASVPAGVFPMAGSYGSINITLNFGQRPFAYTAPSGFKALVTTNLPEPTVVQGDQYFNTVLYTGTGASQSITGVGFQPDWVWIKERNAAADHGLYDAVRGVQNQLESNTTTAETTEATGLTAFGTDGFTVGALAQLNTSADTYVAWNWNAGGSNATNTDGTITSTVRANTTAGFSIVSYTGNGGTNVSVGHGLNSTPELIIVKSREGVRDWLVYTQAIDGSNDFLRLNTTAAKQDSAASVPTSSVFYVTGSDINTSGEDCVAYCFAEIEGYSKFGSYTGNGSADGPFVYTGFRPAWVLIKRTSATDSWVLYDVERSTYNVVGTLLSPDTSGAEATVTSLDIVSNGFKIRGTLSNINESSNTYIYAAFAENPFKYSLAR